MDWLISSQWRRVRPTGKWSMIVAFLVATSVGGTSTPTTLASQASPTPQNGGIADVFPPDFVQVGKAVFFPRVSPIGRPLEERDLGEEIGRVGFVDTSSATLSVCDRLDDYADDLVRASFLAQGDSIYAVVGYATWFRIAARRNGQIVPFEVGCRAGARVGAHLLDIENRVTHISVLASDGRQFQELAVFDAPAEVERLAALVLEAPVDPAFGASIRPEERGQPYVVAFHLTDGTATVRGYWPATGELSQWIAVPPEFGQAIEAALSQGGTPAAQGTPTATTTA